MTLLTKSSGDYRWSGQLFGSNASSFYLMETTMDILPTAASSFESNSSQTILVNSSALLEDEFVNQTLVEPLEEMVKNVTAENVTAAASDSVQATAQLTMALLRDVFNPTVLRGVTGFILWWTVTVWFSSSTIGFVYHTYFEA